MANADRTYVDPSAFRKLYVHEAHSRAFCVWAARVRGTLFLTLHGKTEIVNSIQLAVFRRALPRQVAEGAVADLDSDLAEGRIVLADRRAPCARHIDGQIGAPEN